LDAASVEDAHIGSRAIAVTLGHFAANHAMRFGGNLRSCRLAGADCPYRLVGDNDLRKLTLIETRDAFNALLTQDGLGPAGFAMLQQLAYTDDEGGARIGRHHRAPAHRL